MTASTELVIGDANAEHLVIRALSRSHPNLFDHGAGNWIACEIEVHAGGFLGRFPADLRAEDFSAFMEEAEALGMTLDGSASFSTLEGQITFSLATDGRGQLRVRGKASDASGSDNRLDFGFDIDQTYVPQICGALQVLVTAFPVVGATEP